MQCKMLLEFPRTMLPLPCNDYIKLINALLIRQSGSGASVCMHLSKYM